MFYPSERMAGMAASLPSSTTQQDILGLVDAGGEIRRAPAIGMKLFIRGAMRASDFLRRSARVKAEDLIGLLFRHRAALRKAARPRVTTSIICFTPSGRQAVHIRFQESEGF